MLQKLNRIPKRWLAVVAATALLSVGLTAGAIAAAGFEPAGAVSGKAGYAGYAGDRSGPVGDDDRIIQRVAEIINVDAETLANAIDTAINELSNEEFAAQMDELVAEGTLTAEQSAAAVAWFNDRPAEAGHIAFMGVMTDDTDRLARMLAKGVSHGALTQADADAIIAWHGQRPDFIPAYHGGMHDGHGRHHRGGKDGDRQHRNGGGDDDSTGESGAADGDGSAG